ncbi:MAG: glycoside hydrolase family 38 C-terminal domain-containing protein [Cyanobacteria bacterium J06642_2]
MNQQLSESISKLRQIARCDLLSSWWGCEGDDASKDALEPRSLDRDPPLLLWPQNRTPIYLKQTWTVPNTWQGVSVTGAMLRFKVAWWADWAAIDMNGTRIQEGDLFDRDCRLLLTDSAAPGQTWTFELNLKSPGHDTGALQTSMLLWEWRDRPCDPGKFADELAVLRAYESQLNIQTVAWDDAVSELERSLAEPFDDSLFQTLAEVRQALLPLGQQLKQRTVHFLGNAHLDVAWLWPIAETRDVAERTFESALNLQQQYPELIFNQTTALSYQWIEERNPATFDRIRAAVKSERWDITSGTWVEPDLNLPCGEALVRQVLYGKSYFQAKFDRDVVVAWFPDSFGFNWQLPQILNKSGYKTFVTQKLAWNDTNSFPHQWFWWQGLDGSKILAHCSSEIGQAIEPEAIASFMAAQESQHELQDGLWFFGVGDHGGGPTADMLDIGREWAQSELFFTVNAATSEQYFDLVRANLNTDDLPVWNDELFLELHRGAHTTKADQKRQNREVEMLLRNIEIFSAIASLSNRMSYPHQEIQTAWREALTNQFHDILPGSAIPEVFEDANRAWEDARQLCADIRDRLHVLRPMQSEAVETLTLWNLTSWKRSDLVLLEGRNRVAAIRAETGEALPFQVTNDGILFRPPALPGLSQIRIQIEPGEPSPFPFDSDLNTSRGGLDNRYVIENNHIRVEIYGYSGTIGRIIDKRSGRSLLSGLAELQCFADKGQYWDAWNIDPDYESKPLMLWRSLSTEIVERGPLRATVRIVKRFQHSTVIQDIQLEADAPYITICNQIDWNEEHVLLKACFPLDFEADFVTCEIPFGAIARSTRGETPAARAKWEVPALRWADLSGEDVGLAILNDCKYGYDAKPSQLRLSLLRSPTWPHPTSDRGSHEFTYCLCPHRGNWQAAHIVRQGWNLNVPLQLGPALDLESGRSVLEISASNVVLTAFKQAETGLRWIVRLYESHGDSTSCKIKTHWPIATATECDLLERDLSELESSEKSFTCEFEPFEIKTLAIAFATED